MLGWRAIAFKEKTMKKKIDLRFNDHKEAIIEMANAIEDCPLTNRALALMIFDSCKVTMTQAMEILNVLPELSRKYLKAVQ